MPKDTKPKKRKRTSVISMTPHQKKKALLRKRYDIDGIVSLDMAPDDPYELQIKVKWTGYDDSYNSFASYNDMRINLILKDHVNNLFKTKQEERYVLMANVKERNARRKFLTLNSKTSAQILCEDVGVFDFWEYLVVQAGCLMENPSEALMNYLHILEFKNYFWWLEQSQAAKHKAFADKIKEIEGINVVIENFEDFEIFQGYTPLASNKITDGGDDQPIVKLERNGCECKKCNINSGCCPKLTHEDKRKAKTFAYRYPKEKVPILSYNDNHIIECGLYCHCSINCQNRLTQRPPQFQFIIFKTRDKGWGVKTADGIPAGSFISEYRGEVLKDEDYHTGRYVYDIGETYVLDAREYGSIARLVNHSCLPNAHVFKVTDCRQIEPTTRICLFALRDIKADEEITIDYIPSGRDRSRKKPEDQAPFIADCRCGQKHCRKVIF